jgi:hypothetical protein
MGGMDVGKVGVLKLKKCICGGGRNWSTMDLEGVGGSQFYICVKGLT